MPEVLDTDEIVRQRRLPVRSGAVITAIVQGSPADQAGLPLGAVIVALDGRRIDSPSNLTAAIRTAPTDREIELSYYEGDRLSRKRIHLLGALILKYTEAAELVNFGAFIGFMAVNLCVIKHYWLRRHARRMADLLLPALGFIVCLYIWLHLGSTKISTRY